MTKNYEFPEELRLVTDEPIEDKAKSVKEAQQKVVSLLPHLEAISQLQEPQLSELSESLNIILGCVEKCLRKEATWTNQLKERLEKEGWQVTISPRRGPDIQAHKGKRTIFMEVKGEPVSAKKPSGQRVHYVGEALLSILSRMQDQSSDVHYCIAFPDNDKYLRAVKQRLHAWVREKLGLYVLFLKDGAVKALCPAREGLIDLRDFDELFEK